MTKRMLIDALHPEEMRVAIADNSQIYEFDFVTAAKKQLKGNIYLAKITRVEPSLQAAFVEYGGGKQGFLPFAEIHPDYYQIPVSDRKRLIEEVEQQAMLDADEGDEPHDNETGDEKAITDATLAAADMPLEQVEGEADTSEPGIVPMEFTIPVSPMEPMDSITLQSEFFTLQEETPAQAEAARNEFLQSEPLDGAESSPAFPESAINAEPATGLPADAETAEKPKREDGNGDDVETIVNEEEEISSRNKRVPFFKRYRIQEVIKRGQVVLVQVIKEERGNKGVSLTTYLSLPGRYCVLMPNSPRDGGVSRKISDGDTRKRLKQVMAELKTARGMSVIIRTAGIDRTRTEIKRDFDYLVKLWNQVRENTLASTAPALIYEESDLIKRAIRDQYTSDIAELMVEGDEGYKTARDFMKMLLPSHTPRVKHYRDNTPLFYAYGIEEQLLSMHDPVVKLKSGGYIVLSPTEALISIDVNSGRSTGERNIEETAAKTNLEAATEIARQLRLRDLAGLIVIDFIDMMESRNRRNVERTLKEALKSDRAKIQLGRISPFGLLEMSRQRLRPSIAEASTVQCPHCIGRGVIRSNESMTIQIIRSLEKDAAAGNWQLLKLSAPEHMALHLLNHKRALLSSIEERYGVQIQVLIDHDMTASNFTIERTRKTGQQRAEREEGRRDRHRDRDRRGNRNALPPVAAEDVLETIEEPMEAEAGEESLEERPTRDRPRRRRRRRGGRDRENDGMTARNEGEAETSETEEEAISETTEAVPADDNFEPRPARGSRGRGRGRRRWKDGERNGNAEGEPREASAPREDRFPAENEVTSISVAPSNYSESFQPAPAWNTTPPTPTPTQRPEGEPARKGWWQKMIELD